MRGQVIKLCIGASLFALATPALAQNTPPKDTDSAATNTTADIIVEARRRDETIQDVPLVVNAVTDQTLDRLNIRELKDITSVVPGLALGSNVNGVGAIATLRGINYDVNASGNNGTVEFYLNDAPITSNVVLQSMFDIGQIEVLRGPQGTLRGRASPSGSITLTTHDPNLSEFGGYLTGTVNTIGGVNLNGALNLPIIKDVLAVRVAGLFDNNEVNRVHSLNDPGVNPYGHTRAERVTLRFEPTDTLKIIGSYQHFRSSSQIFDQIESANFADPTQPASPIAITPHDRLSLEDFPRLNRFKADTWNIRAQWKFAGQKLDYVGSWSHDSWYHRDPNDVVNFFGTAYSGSTAMIDPFSTGFSTTPSVQNAAQFTTTGEHRWSHELRLSSDTRLFGVADYVVGGLITRSNSPINLWSMTPLFLGPVAPTSPYEYLLSNFTQDTQSRTLEKSLFGNITVHIDSATEISGGLRYINYRNKSDRFTQTLLPPFILGPTQTSAITTGITPLVPTPEEVDNNVIYSATIKHKFNDNIMIYASTGSSWRASAQTNGVIDGQNGRDLFPFGSFASLLQLPSEKSKSYEVGLKTQWMDRKLIANITYYHQDFSNYFYSTSGVYVVQRSALGPAGSTTAANVGDSYFLYLPPGAIATGVPVKVNGVEGDFAFAPSPRFNVSGTVSYSLGKIQNASVPCNTASTLQALAGQISLAQLVAANGGQQVAFCKTSQRSGVSAPFSASLQSEYNRPLTGNIDGFIRGLATIYGNSQNDPANPLDDIKSYALVNVYLGVRSEDGAWELTGYVKNLFNVERVLSRDPIPYSENTLNGPVATTYRGSTGALGYALTPPREFGINVRYAFGSR